MSEITLFNPMADPLNTDPLSIRFNVMVTVGINLF